MTARAELDDLGLLCRRMSDLGESAGEEHEHQVGTHRGRGSTSHQRVDDPPNLLGSLGADAFPTAGNEPPGCVQRHCGHCGASAGRRAENPLRWMAGKEDDGEGEDEEKPRDDEAEPAEDGTDRSAQPPRTEDRQLSRRWTRQKVGGSDAIFELLGIQPVPFVDTHATE